MGYFDDARGRRSEELAFAAEQALQRGDAPSARRLYAEAAELETEVVRSVPRAEERIRGVLGVSAAALWLKAGDHAQVVEIAAELLADERLPADAREQLLEMQQEAAQKRGTRTTLVIADWNLDEMERLMCEGALQMTGSIVKAATLLGITRHALKRRITKHGIEWPRAGDSAQDPRSSRADS